jgi:multidrug resistance efflux pump
VVGAKAKRREWWHYLAAAVGLCALLGIVYGAYAVWFSLTHVRASYARVSGLVISISAKDDTKVDRILVSTGERVRKGQVVALLDKAAFDAEANRAEANLQAAKSALVRAETDLEMTIRQTAASTEEADAQLAAAQGRLAQAEADMEMQSRQQRDEARKASAELAAAKANLARLQSGARPQEIAQAKADTKAAESQLANATAQLRRMEKLQEQGAVSAQALDAARTDKEVAEATVAAVREKLSLLQSGSRQEEIEAAKQAVAAAEAGLAVANAKTYEGTMKVQQVVTRRAEQKQAAAFLRSTVSQGSSVALKEQDVLAQRAAVAETQAAVEAAKARVSDAVLRSNENGVVVRGPGRSVHAGEVVTKGAPIVTIVATDSPLWISASLSELVVGRVREGQRVLIKLDAFRGRALYGKVAQVGGATEISTTDTSPWQLQQVPVKITFEPKGMQVIPGMTCRAWLDVRR